jgi:RNA polymerase sigma-70 factor (ECF subfamily)
LRDGIAELTSDRLHQVDHPGGWLRRATHLDVASTGGNDGLVAERLAPAWQGGRTAATDHEESLLRHLYAEHAGPLLAFVLRLTGGDRQRAEDIVQETLLRAWRNAHKLYVHPDRSLRPWLVTVARRIAIDGYRVEGAHAREVYDHEVEACAGPSGYDPDRVVDSVVVSEALGTLSRVHREILVETYFMGRTVAEAAEQLEIPLGTAKSRVYYALRALREALEQRGLARHGD